MHSFEIVRQIASRLHDKLVLSGANPIDAYALVIAAAAELKLELAFLKSDDPTLKGARALYDAQCGIICCADTGSPTDKALLIAHEIGHQAVHAKSTLCSHEDINPSRSSEAVPIGMQRVEDYGAHERRELEANVFAREFVFPRSLARKLYTNENLTTVQISQKTSLPLSIIRQQVLDSHLLPEITLDKKEADLKPSMLPDKVQEKAACVTGKPFQLQAGPGTGKTRTLVKRIEFLLSEKTPPSSILVLTFSNKTASELSERLEHLISEEGQGIWIGTFHAFGLDIVRRFHDRLGLDANPTLFDRSDAIAILEEILPTLPLKHYRNLWDPVIVLRDILQAISRAKDELVSPNDYRILAQQMLKSCGTDEEKLKTAEKCMEVAEIYHRYEVEKLARKAVDFGDLIMMPALLLETDAPVRKAVQLRHRQILVDEYQDVNRASVRLVKALAGDGKNLWTVGDARQSIYRFRGASSANMAAFSSDFMGAESDQLGISYRSTQKNIDAFLSFSKQMGSSTGMKGLSLQANRGQGTSAPQLRKYETSEDEIGGVAASIKELEAQGIRLRDQAILCRTNSRLDDFAAGLEARGIPVLHLGSLFERDEIRDLLSVLSMAVDSFGSGLVRIAAMPRYNIPLQDVLLILQIVKGGQGLALDQLSEISETAELSTAAKNGLRQLASDLQGFTSSQSPWDFLVNYCLDRTGLVRDIALTTTIGMQMKAIAIWQFLNFLGEGSILSSGAPVQRTLDRVRNLVLLNEERDLRQVPDAALQMNAVRLMTIHASKGLEFEAVHIPGLTKSGIPSSYRSSPCAPPEGMISGGSGSVSEESKISHSLEEECLFFVAMSRARTFLRMYLFQKQSNGNVRNPSDFIERVGGLQIINAPPIIKLATNPSFVPPVKITLPKTWPITDSRMASYNKCPRRFFYTHVLGIGNARRNTPFSKTHDCIYKLIEWLSKEQISSPPSLEKANATFEVIWQKHGPHDHAFAEDYRSLAARLIQALLKAGAGRRFLESQPLAIDFDNGVVLVEPDEIAKRDDGIVVIRRLRTGSLTESEHGNIEYALYLKAASKHFGSSAVVESVHLTNEVVETVSITPRKLKNHDETAEDNLRGISGGNYYPEQDAFRCPRCPHFFICAATPKGPLEIK